MPRKDEPLAPMIDWIGPDWPVYHGERGDMDPDHPEACLCGAPIYYLCDGPGIASMTLYAVDPEVAP